MELHTYFSDIENSSGETVSRKVKGITTMSYFMLALLPYDRVKHPLVTLSFISYLISPANCVVTVNFTS